MALTTAFLNTCREAVGQLAELATFRAALQLAQNARRANRIAAWHAAYSPTTAGPSPAYLLRQAIRDTINAQADIAGTLGPLDRESAYRTVVAEFVPTYPKPPTDEQEQAALEQLLREDTLS